MIPVRGADVSVIQGTVPWKDLAAVLSFAFARCQVGNDGKDLRFDANVAAMLEFGILPSAYHFPFALRHLDPVAQADLFAKASLVGHDAHPLGADKGELPPAFDLEWPPPDGPKGWAARGLDADFIVDWALACLARMTANTGVKPIVYSYPYFIQACSKAKNFAGLMKYKLWIAGGPQYEKGDGHIPDLDKERPPIVAGWGGDWLFWQHDGNGGRRLPNGADADFNVFRYDVATLHALAQATEPQLPAPDPVEVLLAHQATSNLIVEDAVAVMRAERAAAIAEAA